MVVDRLKQYQISSQAPPVQTTIAKVHSSSTYSEPDEALDATTGGGKPPLTVRPLPGLPGIKEDSTSITIADANLPTLDAFLKQADTVQERIQVVHSNTRELAHQYSISLRSTNPIEMQDCSERIETLVASIHQSADVIKLTLRSMQDTTRGLQEAKDASRVADLRIFENQNNFLLRQFMEVMSSFHSTQSENEKRFKDQVVRRLKAKFRSDDGGTISDAKAEAMALQILEHGSGDAIFMQSKHKLEEIIETRNEVFKIEQSLRALHQLFADVATLIHEQSDLMNSIEHNVQTTSNYVEKAVSELKTARRYNKKAKRKLCCITATVILIVGGICVIIFGFRLVKF